MRLGVWVPEGCGVDDEKAKATAETWREPGRPLWGGWKGSPWVTGEPLRDGREWGSQLSSLYALSVSWGEIAAQFVSSKERPQDLRNFVNSWKAETWEVSRRKTTWEQLGERVIAKESRCLVPEWASLLTIGIDRQSAGGDRFPWVVDAWGPENRVQTIAYSEAGTFDEIRDKVLLPTWQHADGGQPLRIAFGLFDANHKPHGVNEFCREMIERHAVQVWPCKGSNRSLRSDFEYAVLGENTANPGMAMFHVDTIRSQLWIEHQLTNEGTGYSLYHDSLAAHQDFLEQLMNDAAVHDLDTHNNPRESWNRIDENIPNDFRDCRRYAYVARLIALRGRDVPPRVHMAPPKRSAVIGSGVSRPDGGSWL